MKLTETERIILENTDEQCKYIARDSYGNLQLFCGKPKKGIFRWFYVGVELQFVAFDHLFQDIKWSDEEPLQFRNEHGEFIL